MYVSPDTYQRHHDEKIYQSEMLFALNVSDKVWFEQSRKTTETQRRPTGDGLANANFGEKYEHHIKQMHQRLTEHQNHIVKLEQIQHATEAEVDSILNELNDARQALRNVESNKNNLQIDMVSVRREMTAFNRQLSDLRGAMAAAEIAQMTEINQVREEVDSAQAKRLEEELKAKEESMVLSKQRAEELERQMEELSANGQKIASRLAELEELRLTEVHDMKEELHDVKKNAQDWEQQKEMELNDLVEEVANVTAMYNENMTETAQVRVEQAEVQELLELRADIQRRESSHAVVIEGQGKRIEHLDSEYKKEQVMRKRYFNQIEDLKGKIRVYCRVRPMLPFEKSRRQEISVAVPDDMTITHPWKEEKKDREYVFDNVFTPDIKQEQVKRERLAHFFPGLRVLWCRFLKVQSIWFSLRWTDTMSAFLPMARRDLARHLPSMGQILSLD